MIIIKTDTAILNFDNLSMIYMEKFGDQSRLYAKTHAGDDVLIYINTPTKAAEVFDGILCCLENDIRIIKV